VGVNGLILTFGLESVDNNCGNNNNKARELLSVPIVIHVAEYITQNL
jgi:hypothetical protein